MLDFTTLVSKCHVIAESWLAGRNWQMTKFEENRVNKYTYSCSQRFTYSHHGHEKVIEILGFNDFSEEERIIVQHTSVIEKEI